MALASNAIISVTDYLTFVGKDSDSPNISEERIELFINVASAFIEEYTNRKWLPAVTDGTEIKDGTGRFNIYVNHPNMSLTSLAYWDGSSWTSLDSNYSYTTDASAYMIWFTDGNVFWRGDRNWRITYSYGYDLGNAPILLQKVACALVQRYIMLADGKEGVSSESMRDHSTTYTLTELPLETRMQLDALRRISFG